MGEGGEPYESLIQPPVLQLSPPQKLMLKNSYKQSPDLVSNYPDQSDLGMHHLLLNQHYY